MSRTCLSPASLGLAATLLLLPLSGQLAPPSQKPYQSPAPPKVGEVEILEARVAANPEDLESRARLLDCHVYYDSKKSYAAELGWLIEHHPESAIHDAHPAWLAIYDVITLEETAARKLSEMWREQVSKAPDNPRILLHAASQSMSSDVSEALKYLQHAHAVASADQRISKRIEDIYFVAATLHITQDAPPRWKPIADRVLRDMDESTDAELIGGLGLRLGARRLPRPGTTETPIDRTLDEWAVKNSLFSQRFLDRARLLDPQNGRWSSGRVPDRQNGPAEISQFSPVAVLSSARPVYPPEALEAGVSGTVTIAVRVDEAGRIESTQVVSGPPVLREAAEEAVRKWVFSPRQVDGKAVKGETQVRITFQTPEFRPDSAQAARLPAPPPPVESREFGAGLARAPKDAVSASPVAQPKSARISVGREVQKAKLVVAPPPEYPPLAKQAGIHGRVRLIATINTEGKVIEHMLVAGHPLLQQAAIDALYLSRYQPTLLDGRPVEVTAEVAFEF